LTVGVVSFCVLACFFELMSDLGTPLSSGFRQRKNFALANFVIIATIGCVFMSVVTKWGYYDDKANVRRVEGAKIAVEDEVWIAQKAEAEAQITALKATPSEDVAVARAATANAKIASLKTELEDARGGARRHTGKPIRRTAWRRAEKCRGSRQPCQKRKAKRSSSRSCATTSPRRRGAKLTWQKRTARSKTTRVL